jgi:AcrR family transcriptional regulator
MQRRTDADLTAALARKSLVAEEILDKAATIFADRGFTGTGIRDIADAMQMSRPAVYHYFDTKEALLHELVSGVTGDILEFITALRADDSIAHDRKLELLVAGLVERVAAKPAHMRLLAASERTLPDPIGANHANAQREALAHMQAIIADGIGAGAFRPVDERLAALAIFGMCNWVAWWYRGDVGPEVHVVAAELAGVVLQGLPRRQDRRTFDGSVPAAIALLREDLAHLERLLDTESATRPNAS